MKRHGMTEAQFFTMWYAQEGRCVICRKNLVMQGTSQTSAVIDHNHKTGEIRGILCSGCNRGLGYLNDDPTVLKRAMEYLKDNGHYGS